METKRLSFRPFQEDDAPAMFDGWTQDARVAKYCRWHPHTSIDMTKSFLKDYMDTTDPRYPYRNAIILKDTGVLIGAIDVVDISPDGRTAEIGYLISHPYWNKGYITEALGAMIAHLFACGFQAVTACHHIDNLASGKVMQKCGMKYVGDKSVPAKFDSEEICIVQCYEITQT